MIRLFVAVGLPDDLRRRLAGICGGVPGARWTSPVNFHLTLRFIGDVDEGDAEDFAHALAGVRVAAFDVTLAGVGHFGTAEEARILWAGVEKNAALIRLQRAVKSTLMRAGLPREDRRFTPHVTLARLVDAPLPRVSAFLAQNSLFRAGPFAVDGFTLFSSHRSGEGPLYRVEADYPLALAA